MKKVLSVLVAVVVTVLLVIGSVFAGSEDEKKQAQASDVRKHFNEIFPNAPVDSFRESPIPGLYEIVTGSQVIYFSPEGYLIFGEILTKEGKNITAERRNEITSKKVKKIPADKAIVVGSGTKKIIEFSDPDCPYCRSASKYFDTRTDVKRYVYLYPLKTLHPNAEKKAKYILCQKNPEQAYKDVFSGKLDNADLTVPKECEQEAEKKLADIRSIAESLGITGTPAFYINGKQIMGANIPQIEKELSEISQNEQ